MSSVAIPVVSTPAPLGAESDLVRRAARSDEEAFSELYRRHAQTAWRLAQAVAPTAGEAATAVADGFVRVLRGIRRHHVPASDPFRPLLLAGVYQSAIDRLRRSPEPPAATPPPADLGLAGAAFRSLPERWRAAVWLHDVEGLAADRVAPVLGVSPALAAQLVGRGRRALADRFRQAGEAMPQSLGPVLRPLSASSPAALSDVATSAWRASVASDHAGRLVPSLGWLGEHAVAPLRLAVVGVLALGVISVGVLSQRDTLPRGGPVASGTPGASSRAGVNFLNSPGLSAISGFPGDGGLLLGIGGSLSSFGGSGSGGFLSFGGGASGSGSTGGASGAGGGGSGGTGGAATPGGGSTGNHHGSHGGSSPTTTAPASPSTTTPSVPTTTPRVPTTTLPVPTTPPPIVPTLPTTLPTLPSTLPTVPTTLAQAPCSTTTVVPGVTLPCQKKSSGTTTTLPLGL
jgi:DNA-directed RNA polymerase specialized sigma24 family protein